MNQRRRNAFIVETLYDVVKYFELVEINPREHQNRCSDAVPAQLKGLLNGGNPEGVRTFSGEGLGDSRRTMTVTIGFDHGENFYLGTDRGTYLAKIPAQRFVIDIANGRASRRGRKHYAPHVLMRPSSPGSLAVSRLATTTICLPTSSSGV